MKTMKPIPSEDRSERAHEARVKAWLWILSAVLALAMMLFAASKCEGCPYDPKPRTTYPAGSFEECAPAIAHYYRSRGYRCDVQVVSGTEILGRIEGVTFIVNRTAWVSYPAMRADEILWALDHRLGFELAIAGVKR